MPTYEYRCETDNGGCGHTFDVIQSFTDKPKKRCPKCKKHKLVKQFGCGNFIFKGTGFYATDYKQTDISTEA